MRNATRSIRKGDGEMRKDINLDELKKRLFRWHENK